MLFVFYGVPIWVRDFFQVFIFNFSNIIADEIRQDVIVQGIVPRLPLLTNLLYQYKNHAILSAEISLLLVDLTIYYFLDLPLFDNVSIQFNGSWPILTH